MKEFVTKSEEETLAAAAELAESLKAGDVILYRGGALYPIPDFLFPLKPFPPLR